MLSKGLFAVPLAAVLGVACAGQPFGREPGRCRSRRYAEGKRLKSKVSAKASVQLPDNIKFDLSALNSTIALVFTWFVIQHILPA